MPANEEVKRPTKKCLKLNFLFKQCYTNITLLLLLLLFIICHHVWSKCPKCFECICLYAINKMDTAWRCWTTIDKLSPQPSDDSPGLKSPPLEGCNRHRTGQRHWPYSSDPLWNVLQRCQNTASTTATQLRAPEGNYYSTSWEVLIFGRSIKATDLTLSLSNGSRSISLPEQWVLFLTIISAVWQKETGSGNYWLKKFVSAKICSGQTKRAINTSSASLSQRPQRHECSHSYYTCILFSSWVNYS